MSTKKISPYHVRFNFDNKNQLSEKDNCNHLSLLLPTEDEIITPIRRKSIPSKNYQIMFSSTLIMFFIAQSLNFVKSNPFQNICKNMFGFLNNFQQLLELINPNECTSSSNFKSVP